MSATFISTLDTMTWMNEDLPRHLPLLVLENLQTASYIFSFHFSEIWGTGEVFIHATVALHGFYLGLMS